MVQPEKKPCVNCDLDLGNMTMGQGHDTVVWYTVESFIFVGLKFRGFQISDKLVGI